MHLIKYTLIYMQTTNSDWRQHYHSTITGLGNLGIWWEDRCRYSVHTQVRKYTFRKT